MRIRSPASRGSFALRFSGFDVVWALLCPWIALWIRGALILSTSDWAGVALYCSISFMCSLIAFLVFRIHDGMTPLFSVHDSLEVAKAVVVSEFMSFLLLFSVTRLDGIPRSTPLIHALLLSAGLVMARAFVRMMHSEQEAAPSEADQVTEHIVMIGSNRLSSLYMGLLRAYAPERYRIVALLDDRPEMIGRSIGGVRVLGPTNHLSPVIEEFKEHGIVTDRIIVGGDRDSLTKDAMAEIEAVCSDHKIRLDFVPQLIGMPPLQVPKLETPLAKQPSAPSDFLPSRYFQVKRYIDFCLSLLLIILLLPVMLAVATVVLLDVGSPVFFWQRRIGMNGYGFQMHKFRTLKPSFDWRGQPIPATERVSWVGSLLRKARLDELPQLLNVLVGDMSLIGPRPLLPHDQPADSTLRLRVRPGITGWAQVNGATMLNPEDKTALDEWYIRNASPWIDLKIIFRTALFVFAGEQLNPTPGDIDHYSESQRGAAPSS